LTGFAAMLRMRARTCAAEERLKVICVPEFVGTAERLMRSVQPV